jgi:hypothetical protein
MIVICSYCHAVIDQKPPMADQRISHGMCADCLDHFVRQIEGQSLDQYLEGFDTPVLISDETGRIAGINSPASEMLGKPGSEIIGFLGGEVFECDHARLPEGCGKTVHCAVCTIRIAVQDTLKTRKAQRLKPVWIQRNHEKVEMIISTDYVDGIVRIVIEALSEFGNRGKTAELHGLGAT